MPSPSFATPMRKVPELVSEPSTPARRLTPDRCNLVTPEKDLSFPMLGSPKSMNTREKLPFRLMPRRGKIDREDLFFR